MTQKEIVEDAEKHDYSIPASNLNRYLKNNEAGEGRSSLTEEQILWLCQRYCISVDVVVTPAKYSYSQAKKNLNGKSK